MRPFSLSPPGGDARETVGRVGSEQAFHRAGLPELLFNSHLALIVVEPSQKESEQTERGVAEKQAEVPVPWVASHIRGCLGWKTVPDGRLGAPQTLSRALRLPEVLVRRQSLLRVAPLGRASVSFGAAKEMSSFPEPQRWL